MKPEDVDLRHVHYATVLAEELHFGRAAARLHIAQQTLSSQIDRLERKLGVRLFTRDRRHVELTGAGRLFAEHGRRLLDQAATMLTDVREPARPVRVDVVTEGLTSGLVAQHVRACLSDVPLEVVQGQGLVGTLHKLRRGEVDLAFGRVAGVPAAQSPPFRCLLVRLEPIGVVLPVNHPLAQQNLSPADLRGTPLLLHTAAEATDWEGWNTSLATHFGLTIGRRLHGHGRAAANAAALTYGMPTFAPLTAPLPEGLVVRPLRDPVPLCPLWVVWNAERTSTVSAIVDIIDGLAEAMGWREFPRQPWWLPEPDRAQLIRVSSRPTPSISTTTLSPGDR